jgi:hypothetical protein
VTAGKLHSHKLEEYLPGNLERAVRIRRYPLPSRFRTQTPVAAVLLFFLFLLR